MSNSVKLKNYSDVIEEYPAGAAITPGHLIELKSDGTVGVHDSADGNVLPMFALEDELQGKGIDAAYAAGDRVQCWIPYRGDIVNALLANGESVAKGDYLTSTNDGTLQKCESGATVGLVGVAVAAVDMSGSSAVDPSPRVQVRIV